MKDGKIPQVIFDYKFRPLMSLRFLLQKPLMTLRNGVVYRHGITKNIAKVLPNL